jgi:hypothetical protein
MQSPALFDLDDTLVGRGAAFRAWAKEFVIAQGLDDAALAGGRIRNVYGFLGKVPAR